MRLFRVDFQHNMRPPILVRGVTRAQISRQMKERYGDLFLKVDYISHEDAEAQFGHFDLFKNVSEKIDIKKADMGDVIDDFYKSDAPQFKGRSKAKRRQMAIAAKLNTENNKYSDNYEDKNMSNINEISRDMKNRYIKKASSDLYYKGMDQGISANDPNRFNSEKNPKLNDRMDKNRTKSIKRMAGIAKATEEFADFITPESELTEEMYFKVNIQGLPDMYMTASSAGMIKAKLRKMLKNMDMIGDIVKTPKAEVRKAFRMKAMEGEDSQDESTIVENEVSDNEKEISKASKIKSRATVITAMNKQSPKVVASEDFVDNRIKFGKPSEDVFEQEENKDDNYQINFTSILTGDNPFYRPIQEISKKTMSSYVKKAVRNVDDRSFAAGLTDNQPDTPGTHKNNQKIRNRTKGISRAVDKMSEGHDEIQDKNADGKDDNQKPEGDKTAKQFPAPKDAKKKMKQMKMEMKTEVADLVIEKAKLKKNDIKMRAGKLDPKAMAALKTMSQDEAKVLVQGLPSNLRRSTMKELGIREKNIENTVDLILKKRYNDDNETFNEASMSQQQDQATKAYNDNKKSLTSLHRKTKSKGGQVHVDHTDEKGKKRSGRYDGMMRMGAHTYAKIEPHDGKRGSTTLLPLHQAQNIRHVN